MKKPKPGRPIQPEPPVQTEKNNPWGGFASEIIKRTLTDQSLGYCDLAERLVVMGEENVTPELINRRINRGNFSAGFLLMCLEALQVSRIDFQEARHADTIVGKPNAGTKPQKKIKTKGKAALLEGVLDGWGRK